MRLCHENCRTGGLRVMVKDDLRKVLRIEANSFADPWSERDFVEHFQDPDSAALVAEVGRLILGYEVFRFRGPWIELHSCVVRPALRRRGLGSSLVTRLVRLSTLHEGGGILVKVPERNVDAQLFFRHCGFRAARVLHAFLNDHQDLYVMKHSVPEWAMPDFDLGTPEDELVPFWQVKHGSPLALATADRNGNARQMRIAAGDTSRR